MVSKGVVFKCFFSCVHGFRGFRGFECEQQTTPLLQQPPFSTPARECFWECSRCVLSARPTQNSMTGSERPSPEPRLWKKRRPQRAPGLKKLNLERRYWKNQAFNTEWNFQSRMFFFHSGPLSGHRKTRPGIEIFNREWKFQSENDNFKREWKFRAWGNGFFHAFEREWIFFDLWALWVPSRTGGGENSGNALEPSNALLLGRFGYFYFFCSGREGGVRGAGRGGGGGRFFIDNSKRGGGGLQDGRGRGAGRVSAAKWGTWGGGGKYFFSGPPSKLNYRFWGIPAILSRGIPGKALRAFPGSFRIFSGISSGKSQPYWGCGLTTGRAPSRALWIAHAFGGFSVSASFCQANRRPKNRMNGGLAL